MGTARVSLIGNTPGKWMAGTSTKISQFKKTIIWTKPPKCLFGNLGGGQFLSFALPTSRIRELGECQVFLQIFHPHKRQENPRDILLMAQQSCTTKDDDYPSIYWVLTIPSGCLGFLNHQQYFISRRQKRSCAEANSMDILQGKSDIPETILCCQNMSCDIHQNMSCFFFFVWRSKITKRVWKLLRLFKPTNRGSLTYFVSVRQIFFDKKYFCISSYYFYTYICNIYIYT